MGNSRASASGTSNKYGSHAFFIVNYKANAESPAAPLIIMKRFNTMRLLSLALLLTTHMLGGASVKIGDLYYNLDDAAKTAEVTYLDSNSDGNSGYVSGDLVIPPSIESDDITYSVTEIGFHAFNGCSGLKSVTIPESVTTIGTEAFQQCSDLTSVTIPSSITEIGSYAFYRCDSMTSVHITDLDAWFNIKFNSLNSNPLDIAGSLYLNGTEIKELEIPNSVTEIGKRALSGCNMTSVTIPESVLKIGEFAFYLCENLPTVTIPNSVTEIGNRAFACCTAMTSVTIGNSVTEIRESAFISCPSLSSINIYATTPPAIQDDTFINNTYMSATLYVPAGCVDTYKADTVWSKFQNIVDGGFSGVDDVIAAGAAEVTGYYNLQGVRADEPWDGLNIVVYGDGSCRKVAF